MSQDIVRIIFPLISILCVGLNVCSLVILFRTKNLKKSRFNCLVLYLSISDTFIGLQTVANVVNYRFVVNDDTSSYYVCEVIGILTRATTIFSMFQVLLICLERLNATYTTPNIHLKRLTSDRSVAIGFMVTHAYPIAFWIYEIHMVKPKCVILPTVTRLVSLDVPAIILTSATIVLYIVIIFRIVRQHTKIHGLSQQGQPIPTGSNHAAAKMKRNVVTLGVIVVSSALIVTPRLLASVTSLVMGNQSEIVRFLQISTYLMILNPVIDPIIYVLRIRAFRQRLRCTCCYVTGNADVAPASDTVQSNIPKATRNRTIHVSSRQTTSESNSMTYARNQTLSTDM